MTDLLPALKGRPPRPLGGSLVPLIYSGTHLSSAGQSGWPETPHMMHLPSGCAPRIHVLRGNHSSRLRQEKHLYSIPALKEEAFSCKAIS